MIFEHNEDYQSQLKFAWLKFINNEKFDYSFMRPGIFDSWQVSRYYHVDPYNLEVKRLSSSEINKTLIRHEELVEVAKPEIERLYSVIKGSNVYIILTNNEGIVLYSIGDKKNLILSGPFTRLISGSSWNINTAGTNSIASCLATKKPVQIYGCEHFKYHYQTHTCSGAPIFDINDNIIGTINISAFRDEVTSHTLGMIITAAQSIERSLKLKAASSELAKLQNMNLSLHKQGDANFRAKYNFDLLVGSSPPLLQAISESKNAAKHNSNILITGESGTGKEIFAHAIHNASSRRDYPFVAINCGAIPISLAESELFGYHKGAYTGGLKDGAPGKFELANGGTIFLDEIGELPLSIQVSLLRVLESREVVRIGGNKTIKLDIRIIAATNKDLYKAMLDKAFREDLYYRLNVLPIRIPPLRNRGDDIILLANYFIQKYNTTTDHIILNDDVYESLLNYLWPGNIRELSNIIEHAMSIREGNHITLENLSIPLKSCNPDLYHDAKEKKEPLHSIDGNINLINYEANIIISTLRQNKGDVNASAFQLGFNSRTLYRKIKKHNINPKSYRHQL
jgi:Transcriptional regulator containing PAS, AAA-type ATPase, and DNA-binding domains